MGGIDFTDLSLRLVGGFYTFAGVAAVRGTLMSRFLDQAIAAIGGSTPNRAETARELWIICASLIVLAGGVALMLRIDLAVWLFVISALAQVLYLGVLAPQFLDVDDPPDPQGRAQTIKAFVVYLAATAFVLWAHSSGHLTDWRTLPTLVINGAVCAIVGYGAYALHAFFRPASK